MSATSEIGNNDQSSDQLVISLRAYVPPKSAANEWRRPDLGPSDWALVFDCETTTDETQALKFGFYQVRKDQQLWEAGCFINPGILKKSEIRTIQKYSKKWNYQFLLVSEFIENVFFGIGYELRATIIGFNLPFDISRLAIRHGNSRGRTMKGGFSFQLSPHKYRPNVQIKHLSSRVSLIRFTTRPGKIGGRGMRRRKLKPAPRPGYFIDLKTLGAALTSRSFSLASLAEFLSTKNRKFKTANHGQAVTDPYLDYAKQDVQVTWECYLKLLEKFAEHNFSNTLPHQIFSEASIGKAYFSEMNIRPWRQVQPNFPPELVGIILSTYFGGRAEVHHRRIISEVCYCDFLSMYPTVCTLMGLWKFVTANGPKWQDATGEVKQFLEHLSLEDLQNAKFWPQLTALVQIVPDGDTVPIRANYGNAQQNTIGLNHLHSTSPLWFTLADCIASKLLTGKAPKVVRAIRFNPDGIQPDLCAVNIAGNSEYRIDPAKDDFYRRVIDQRSAIKLGLRQCPPSQRSALESAQLTLKILANATSYGNFVEINVEELSRKDRRLCYGHNGQAFEISTDKSEEPGRYFHPLIATLITGAARLMLAITERLVLDRQLDWAFCDTDSMAIVKPDRMDRAIFLDRVEDARRWFDPLNPYEQKGPLLKIENANYKMRRGETDGKTIEPLYSYAISAKRYALFNQSPTGKIVIRKASAHGLGHLLAPYAETDAPRSIPKPSTPLSEIGVERWQHDVWHEIIRAGLSDKPHEPKFQFHPNLRKPAASRYAATTPGLLRWFEKWNQTRQYSVQVRPNTFMLAFQANRFRMAQRGASQKHEFTGLEPFEIPKPVAPFNDSPDPAAGKCFDRQTGRPVPKRLLKTYEEALAQYHLRPEHKFKNGNYADYGLTARRHVMPIAVQFIGKEANRWEEAYFLDETPTQIDYSMQPSSQELCSRILRAGQRQLARRAGVSRRTLTNIMKGKTVRDGVLRRVLTELQNIEHAPLSGKREEAQFKAVR